MLKFNKIFGQKYSKPSSVQYQAQKIVNICLACVFFVGVVLTAVYATSFGDNEGQPNPLPSKYIPDAVKIMLVDEFMEWNGFQISMYDPAKYDVSIPRGTNSPSQTPSSQNVNSSPKIMDEEDIINIQKQVSKEDKKKIFNIIYKRLTRDELDRFVYLSKNGVTVAEKAEVKSLLKTRLSSKEIDQLRAIYGKYQ